MHPWLRHGRNGAITSEVIAGMTCISDADPDKVEPTMILTAHRAVLIDAAATTATAVLMLAARGLLFPYFGLSSPLLLDVTAAAFIVYAVIIGRLAARPTISRSRS